MDGVPPQVGATRILDDGSLWRDLGGVHERLVNDETGVEQSWTFDTKPPSNEIVVEIASRGLDYAGETINGLHFRDATSGTFVRYSAATFVDAAGRRTRVRPTFDRGKITIRVPASVAATASYPAVLDPLVSPELALDAPVPIPTGAARYPKVVAGTAGQFLVAWGDTIGSRTELLAARVKDDGTILDPTALVVSTVGSVALDVAFDGTNYFVVWGGGLLGGRRIRPSDGTFVEPTDTSLKLASVPVEGVAVAWNGIEYLVAYKAVTPSTLSALRVQAGAVVGSPTVLASTGALSDPAIASDGNGFFVTYGGKYGRRVKSDGTLPDAAPIQFAGLSAGTGTRVAYDGAANYYAAWVYLDWIYGARIRASDGVVLDADDTFSGISGSRVIAKNTIGSSHRRYSPRIGYDGTKLIASWIAEASGFYAAGAVIDPGTGDPKATSYIGSPYPDGKNPAFEIAWSPTKALLTWGQHADGIFIGYGPEEGIWASTAERIGDDLTMTSLPNFHLSRANEEIHPVVSSNGTDFLLGWVDPSYGLYVARVRGSDGTILDPSGVKLPLSAGASLTTSVPVIASDGTDYLVAWPNAYTRVKSADGSFDAPPRALGGAPTSVAASRRNYLVTWLEATVKAARIDIGTGLLVDTTPIPLSASGASSASIAGNQPSDPDKGSFLVTFLQSGSLRMQIVRDKAGTTPILPATLATSSGSTLFNAVASDGNDFLVVWNGKGTRVASLDMAILDKTGTTPGIPVMSFFSQPALFWSGSSYMLAIPGTTIQAGRYDGTLAPLDGASGFAIAPSTPAVSIAGGANSSGKSMIAYTHWDKAIAAASRVAYRFVEDGPTGDAGPDVLDDVGPEVASDTGADAADDVAIDGTGETGADGSEGDATEVSVADADDDVASDTSVAETAMDSAPVTDSSAPTDAAADTFIPPVADAARVVDIAQDDSGGCGCRTTRDRGSNAPGLIALAVAAVLVRRRRVSHAPSIDAA